MCPSAPRVCSEPGGQKTKPWIVITHPCPTFSWLTGRIFKIQLFSAIDWWSLLMCWDLNKMVDILQRIFSNTFLIDTVKPVCNDHLYNKIHYLWFIQESVLMKTEGTNLLLLPISAFWSSSRWPLATYRWAPEGREICHQVVVIDRFHCNCIF